MKIYICYPEGKAKALTMSYDDGKMEDIRLIEIFDKYGIKGTFNINYELMLRDQTGEAHPRIAKEQVKELYRNHEVATHTATHPTIARCPLTEVAQEILDDRKGLEELTGKLVRGHAYPNGSYNAEIKQLFKQLGIAYGRIVGSSHSFELPSDPLEWQATCHHNDSKLMELAKSFADFKKKQYLKLMYVWGHSYEFAEKNNWEVIEEFCKFMGGREDIWYATNIEIIDYLEADHNLKFSADNRLVFNPSAQSVWLAVNDHNYVEVRGGECLDLNTGIK